MTVYFREWFCSDIFLLITFTHCPTEKLTKAGAKSSVSINFYAQKEELLADRKVYKIINSVFWSVSQKLSVW